MSLVQTPVGELAATIPGASALFRKHHIDFCCGGGQSLADACVRKGLDASELAESIAGLKAGNTSVGVDWNTRPLGELIDHIVANFHQKHRRDLPELIRLSARVEAVHGENPACPRGLAATLKETLVELEMHMRKEEEILFPMIKRGMGAMTDGPISVMQHEHDEHGERLRRIESLAHDFVLPPGACNTWRASYNGVQALVGDVMEHIHLENNILFPRALRGDR